MMADQFCCQREQLEDEGSVHLDDHTQFATYTHTSFGPGLFPQGTLPPSSLPSSENINSNNNSDAVVRSRVGGQRPTSRAQSPSMSPSSSVHSDMSTTVKAVAMASALVGEVVVESPTSDRRAVKPDIMNRTMKQLLDHKANQHTLNLSERSASYSYNETARSTRARVSGLVNFGMRWWEDRQRQKQKEKLEREVEETRQRLFDSQRSTISPESSLHNNATFQQMTNMEIRTSVSQDSSSSPQEQQQEGESLHISSPHLSKSGMGISVDVTIPHVEDDNFVADSEDWEPEVKIVPDPPRGEGDPIPPILTQEQANLVAKLVLPPTIAYAPWKRVYSLARDGDSFDTFLRLAQSEPHTLLVVRTTKNAVFGGYADSAWVASHQGNPEFFGSAQASLYSIEDNNSNNLNNDDDRDHASNNIRVYKWAGVNRYIQYVDVARNMMALGGGGGEFGLCLESDFQRGSTGRCATFANEPLCDEENFRIVDVECYGFLTGHF